MKSHISATLPRDEALVRYADLPVGDDQRFEPVHGTRSPHSPSPLGFTILEVLVVMAIMGILLAIAAPGWLKFYRTHHLTAAQDQVYHAIRLAQFEANRRHIQWQASFQNVDGQGQWAVHPIDTLPMSATWTDLPPGVQFDPDETTLRLDDGYYEVQFSHRGHVNGQLGRVTVMVDSESRPRRCVFVSTLLGALRKAKENRTPRNGRYCY